MGDLREQAAEAEIQSRLAALRRLPFAELSRMPEWRTEESVLVDEPVRITTYRELVSSGLLRVVVQLSTKPQRFLMFVSTHQVFAQGFETTSTACAGAGTSGSNGAASIRSARPDRQVSLFST
jgi:hypothetical protein